MIYSYIVPKKLLRTFSFCYISSFKMCQAVEKVVCILLATMEEKGHSEKLSHQCEVLLYCSVAISWALIAP